MQTKLHLQGMYHYYKLRCDLLCKQDCNYFNSYKGLRTTTYLTLVKAQLSFTKSLMGGGNGSVLVEEGYSLTKATYAQ